MSGKYIYHIIISVEFCKLFVVIHIIILCANFKYYKYFIHYFLLEDNLHICWINNKYIYKFSYVYCILYYHMNLILDKDNQVICVLYIDRLVRAP